MTIKYVISGLRWSLVFSKIYAFSSTSSTNAQEWSQKADMPLPRLFFSVAAVDGEVYTIGGTFVYPVDTVNAYNPDSDEWVQKASLPSPRAGVMTSVVNGKIYAIGGWDVLKPALGTVEEYDPSTDKWTQKTDMPTPRSLFSAVVVNNKIYTIGGVAQNVGPVLGTVEEYDPSTDTWSQKPNMPNPRSGTAAGTVDGKIYILGGTPLVQGPVLDTLEEYDPSTNTWTQKTDMPTARTALAVSVIGSKIYAIGGTPNVQGPGLMSVEVYDPKTDNWIKGPDMPTARVFLGSGTVNNRIYAVGGVAEGLGPLILPTVEEFAPGGLSVEALVVVNIKVRIAPASIESPPVGEQLVISVDIADGVNVSGYEGVIQFDSSALRFVSLEHGSYLPGETLTVPTNVMDDRISFAQISTDSVGSTPDGSLVTITFEVINAKYSQLTLSDVLIGAPNGVELSVILEHGEILEPPNAPWDTNNDGRVNILDLTFVASHFGQENAPPEADVNGDGKVNILDLTLVASHFGETT